jgi:hypothetical protein
MSPQSRGNLCQVLPGDTTYVVSGSLLDVRCSAMVVGSLGDVSEAVTYHAFYGKALPFLGDDKGQNRRSGNASDMEMRRPLVGLERCKSRL